MEMDKIVRKWDDFCKKNMKVTTEKDGTRVPHFDDYCIPMNGIFRNKNYYIKGTLDVVYCFNENDKFRGPSLPFAVIISNCPSCQKALECFYEIIDRAEINYRSNSKNYPFGAIDIIIMNENIYEIKNISYVKTVELVDCYDVPEYEYFEPES